MPESLVNHLQQYNTSYDHESLLKILDLTSQGSFYSRFGDDSLPFAFGNKFIDTNVIVSQTFQKTFEEVTDQRCKELMTQCNDRPWIVLWSGGIDSTVILTSILKNFSKSQLEQITVACNNVSVFENPLFFYNHVLKNFKTINSTDRNLEKLLDTHYIISGNPGDLLQGSGLGLHAKNSGLDLTKPWNNCSGSLLKFLINQVGNKAAEWVYTRMEQNILSCPESQQLVNTVADWFWWINFNWKWVGDCWSDLERQNLKNTCAYFKFFRNWYETHDYQLWAINYGRYSLVQDGSSLGNYKKSSKQYIYDYDQEPYYFTFKTKTHSTGRVRREKTWLCLLNDNTTLDAEQDLDLILELLPSHLNVK